MTKDERIERCRLLADKALRAMMKVSTADEARLILQGFFMTVMTEEIRQHIANSQKYIEIAEDHYVRSEALSEVLKKREKEIKELLEGR